MITLLVNFIGLALIATIVWWFWLAKRGGAPGEKIAESTVILVKDGVYEPDRIQISAGTETTLHFRREDPSPCAEYVVFGDFDVSAQLALERDTEVIIPAAEAGEYAFTCQMQMYRGTLVVV
jgi:plastocyanin domain-containing protein